MPSTSPTEASHSLPVCVTPSPSACNAIVSTHKLKKPAQGHAQPNSLWTWGALCCLCSELQACGDCSDRSSHRKGKGQSSGFYEASMMTTGYLQATGLEPVT